MMAHSLLDVTALNLEGTNMQLFQNTKNVLNPLEQESFKLERDILERTDIHGQLN